MRSILILAALGALLAACDAPGVRLRDNYLGMRLLEPALTPEPARRDAGGNSIIAPAREQAQWPVYRP